LDFPGASIRSSVWVPIYCSSSRENHTQQHSPSLKVCVHKIRLYSYTMLILLHPNEPGDTRRPIRIYTYLCHFTSLTVDKNATTSCVSGEKTRRRGDRTTKPTR